MCGIVGILALSEIGKSHLSKINDATESLSHRGPDCRKVTFPDEKVALGHARLSIIDVSEQSNQPFTDISERYHIIYNGEIFNFQELRENLKTEGNLFNTTGDVEVLLNAFIQKNENCLGELNGFFAFSVYDVVDKKLFLARDRFGVKPLYYFQNKDLFCWSSELNSIQKIVDGLTLNHDSIVPYLQFNYLPGKESIVKGVNRLEPGHQIKVENGNVKISKYFEQKIHKTTDSDEQIKKQVRNILENAVQLRMISDVPLGSFLSGGIDSTIITGIAACLSPSITTLSIGFKENKQFDESRYAEIASKAFKTSHHCLMLDNNDLLESLDDFLDHIDEPFADSSALNVFILSKFARKHVKVALSGDGADEVFGGYNKHRAEWMIKNKTFFNSLVGSISWASNFFPASRQGVLSNKVRQMKRYSDGLQLSDKERYWKWASICSIKEIKELIVNKNVDEDKYNRLKNKYTNLIDGSLNSNLLSDVNMLLPYDMLTKVDMMSMANGLEVRSPFMDYRLINYAFGLDEKYKIRDEGQKLILKEAFAHLIPDELLNRKKHGFEIPLQRWFNRELKSRIENEWLSKEFIKEQGVFNFEKIAHLMKQLKSNNPGDSAATVWAIIVFNHWWKKKYKN